MIIILNFLFFLTLKIFKKNLKLYNKRYKLTLIKTLQYLLKVLKDLN